MARESEINISDLFRIWGEVRIRELLDRVVASPSFLQRLAEVRVQRCAEIEEARNKLSSLTTLEQRRIYALRLPLPVQDVLIIDSARNFLRVVRRGNPNFN